MGFPDTTGGVTKDGEKRHRGAVPHELTIQVAAGGKKAEAARAVIRHALEATDAVPARTAAMLGISRATLYRLIEETNLGGEAYAIRQAARKAARKAKADAEQNEKKTLARMRLFQAIPRRVA